ncbi:putative ankyrin-2-like [Capsicum annuum]|nr:putative ankyrin-2-like [Capsicum annuum]KAF3663463.1 putative ankyrin-2-like [Capsicum annuum]
MCPQLPHHLPPCGSISVAAGRGSSSVDGRLGRDDEFAKQDDRVPPWSNQEIRDLIAIRGELQMEFSSTKQSNLKNLWEMVGVRMSERGYRRSGEQYKSKWKNLITRYKQMATIKRAPENKKSPKNKTFQNIILYLPEEIGIVLSVAPGDEIQPTSSGASVDTLVEAIMRIQQDMNIMREDMENVNEKLSNEEGRVTNLD